MGKLLPDKPVLFNWLVALSFEALGFTELAARLPAAILGLGCVIVTYLFGRKMYDPVTGFVSGMILATSPEFIILSRAVVHDISWFSLSPWLCFSFIWFPARGTGSCTLLCRAGCAILAKGPVGIILPGMIIAIFLTLAGKLASLRTSRFPGRCHSSPSPRRGTS
jgi:4-amino-4-deoxy-L-arabinose transferase-like glycosyltransferase